MKREEFITSIDHAWNELQLILEHNSPVKLGPPELLKFELQQISSSMKAAKESHDPAELERCLKGIQRFVSHLKCLE